MDPNFNFRSEFKTALFMCAGHGDGRMAWLVRGWENLVRATAEHTINFEPGPDDLTQAENGLSIADDWEWSDEPKSLPYCTRWNFEDGAFVVYRLKDDNVPFAVVTA